MLHVASVAVFDRKDRLLFGLRKDSWKWNLPGGCVEKGEDHLDAAQRELNEEAGILVPKHKLEYLGSETVRAPDLDREITVHSYRIQLGIDQIPTTKNDPDKECVCWKWVDVSNGIPEPFAKRLHNKRDVTLRFLGLQGNGKKLRKYDQNEIGVLARELEDVDFSSPSEQPWNVSHAGWLGVQRHSDEKLFNKPTWEDEIRKKEEELAKMAFDPQHLSAIRRDSVKKGRKIIASPEAHQIPEPVLPYRQLFDERLRNSPEVAQPRWESPGGIGTKVVYDADDQPFLLKPYHEDPMDIEYAMVPMYGWAELTSQDMYHAGGIGDLHQKVFLTDYDVDGERVPMIAIAMDPDMREVDDLLENEDPLGDPQKDHPRLRKDIAKIAFMDFLTGNLDRHGSNLMWGYKDGVPKLLSIDHGRSFQYLMGAGERWGTHHDPDKLNRDYLWHYNVATKGYWPLHDIIGESWDDEALEDAVQWWTANREKIVGAFARNLKAVKSPILRYHLARNLRDRKKVLDRFAEDWQTSERAAAAYLPPNDEGEDLDDIQSVKLYPFYWWKV